MEQYLSGERPIVPTPAAPVSALSAPVPAEVSQTQREVIVLEACLETTLATCKLDGMFAFDDGLLPRLKQVTFNRGECWSD